MVAPGNIDSLGTVHKVGIVGVGNTTYSSPQKEVRVPITDSNADAGVQLTFRALEGGLLESDSLVRIWFPGRNTSECTTTGVGLAAVTTCVSLISLESAEINVRIKRDVRASAISVTPSCRHDPGNGCFNIGEGQSSTYTVSLDEQPGPDKTVTITPREASGSNGLTFSPTSVSFTSSDWNTDKTITVSAPQDDDLLPGSFRIAHRVSGDVTGVPAGGALVAYRRAQRERLARHRAPVADRDLSDYQVGRRCISHRHLHPGPAWEYVPRRVVSQRGLS